MVGTGPFHYLMLLTKAVTNSTIHSLHTARITKEYSRSNLDTRLRRLLHRRRITPREVKGMGRNQRHKKTRLHQSGGPGSLIVYRSIRMIAKMP